MVQTLGNRTVEGAGAASAQKVYAKIETPQ
jgi:hypothetical protein